MYNVHGDLMYTPIILHYCACFVFLGNSLHFNCPTLDITYRNSLGACRLYLIFRYL